MDLKAKDGWVEFTLISGKDRVANKMLESEAKELIATGNVKKDKGVIIVDDRFIFETDTPISEAVKEEPIESPVEEPAEEPVTEVIEEEVKDRPLSKKSRRKGKK